MKKWLSVLLLVPLALVLLLLLSFVLTQVKLRFQEFPPPTSVPDWEVLIQEEIPSVVTRDADGDRRITQVWIAGLDGEPYLRTGDSRWFANLKRDPNLELRIGGVMLRCVVQVVSDEALTTRVHAAFHEKYPQRSKFFRRVGISTPTALALDCPGD